ncbi:hypothetical protein PEC302107_13450 [Pectobacterium araliae]|uniref:hypothetical protein n=1 Tax=Pectobacterium araliae TaxID=3073862 RepID=UPI00208145C3|nr:hypothetical protein PEC302107_13450 [Pectobacterium carotovorum subsp. carotovorum]
MHKNHDEAIDWVARRLIEDGIYTNIEQAYSDATDIINRKREEVRLKQEKDYFRFRVKSIKKRIASGYEYANIPYKPKKPIVKNNNSDSFWDWDADDK